MSIEDIILLMDVARKQARFCAANLMPLSEKYYEHQHQCLLELLLYKIGLKHEDY